MVTARKQSTTEGVVQLARLPSARQCVYCRSLIRWMRTYLGGRYFCFDADLVARELDDGSGWIPGRFDIRGRLQTVLAPLTMHNIDKRTRARVVMQLHKCPKKAA